MGKQLIFSYGTIQNPEIQTKIFGQEINGIFDSISGYKVLNDLLIDKIKYPRLVPQRDGIVFGKVLELTYEQVHILDGYETESYCRHRMKTDGGLIVDVYFKRTNSKKAQ